MATSMGIVMTKTIAIRNCFADDYDRLDLAATLSMVKHGRSPICEADSLIYININIIITKYIIITLYITINK